MRDQCLWLLTERVRVLAGRLSLSERVVGTNPGLSGLLADLNDRFPELAESLRHSNPEEPYRRAFSLIGERLRVTRGLEEGGYGSPVELLSDLVADPGGPARGLRSTCCGG